jgi:hypothetical protein
VRRTLEIIEAVSSSVKLPNTVRGWDLFDKPGAMAVKNALGKAMREAARWLDKEFKKKPKNFDPDDNDKHLKWVGTRVYRAYERFVKPVQEKHSDFGAADSEPRDIAKNILADYARDRLGFSASMTYWID